MVVDAVAEFRVECAGRTAAWLLSQVNVRPDDVWDVGDATGDGADRRRECSGYALRAGSDPEAEATTSALSALLDRLEPLDQFRIYGSDVELSVRCSAVSDSTQGGLFIAEEVVQRLGRLTADFRLTVAVESV